MADEKNNNNKEEAKKTPREYYKIARQAVRDLKKRNREMKAFERKIAKENAAHHRKAMAELKKTNPAEYKSLLKLQKKEMKDLKYAKKFDDKLRKLEVKMGKYKSLFRQGHKFTPKEAAAYDKLKKENRRVQNEMFAFSDKMAAENQARYNAGEYSVGRYNMRASQISTLDTTYYIMQDQGPQLDSGIRSVADRVREKDYINTKPRDKTAEKAPEEKKDIAPEQPTVANEVKKETYCKPAFENVEKKAPAKVVERVPEPAAEKTVEEKSIEVGE